MTLERIFQLSSRLVPTSALIRQAKEREAPMALRIRQEMDREAPIPFLIRHETVCEVPTATVEGAASKRLIAYSLEPGYVRPLQGHAFC
jgi:hypothetical protein